MFRHPRPEDFFAVVNEVTGRDFTWFFDQVYRGSSGFDYGVQRFAASRPPRAAILAMAARARSGEPTAGWRIRSTTVVVRRYRRGRVSRGRSLVLENKEEVRWHWDGRDRWKSFEVEKPLRAAFAQVDPDHVLLLDPNYTNNSATPRAQARRGGAQVVAGLAGLAAGPPPHLRVLRLMAVMSAFRDGIRRVNGAPMVLAGMFSATLLVALPLSYVLRGMIAAHLGPSLAADAAAAGRTTTGGTSSPPRRRALASPSPLRSSASGRCSTT